MKQVQSVVITGCTCVLEFVCRELFWPYLSIPFDEPLVGADFFQSHGATCVEFLGGDANLCSEAELGSVSEGGGDVVIDTGGIDLGHEAVGCGAVFGDDALGVT